MRSLNWRACCCLSKGGTILPKVALLTTVFASAVALHAWASAPQVRTFTYIALDSTLLRGKSPRPLMLMVRSVVWSPPLVMYGLEPRWFTNPMRLLRPLTLYLILHLLHYPSLIHQSSKILYGQGCDEGMTTSLEAPSRRITRSMSRGESSIPSPLSLFCITLVGIP